MGCVVELGPWSTKIAHGLLPESTQQVESGYLVMVIGKDLKLIQNVGENEFKRVDIVNEIKVIM